MEDPTTQAEREAWWQLFDSVATELGLTHVYTPRSDHDWLPCCLMHGPLHADDCPVRQAQASADAETPCVLCRRPEIKHRDRNGHAFRQAQASDPHRE